MDEKEIAVISPDELRDIIKSSVKKMGPQLSKNEKIEHAKLLVKIFEKRMSPKEAMEVSDQEIAQIYSFANQLFATNKFAEAKEMFKMLVLLEPDRAEFSTALGACFHHLHEYTDAITFYMTSSYLNNTDPVPLFYAYDCFRNLHNDSAAAVMLACVLARAGDQPQYAKIKEQAQPLLEELKKKFNEQQIEGKK